MNPTLYLLEELKIPMEDPYSPEDWKDWYHYVMFDPVTQSRLLFNICLSGRPNRGNITTTAFLTVPEQLPYQPIASLDRFYTYGFSDTIEWDMQVKRHPLCINTGNFYLRIDNNKAEIDVDHNKSGIRISINGVSVATPLYIPELAPFGKGFIGWGLIPGVDINGTISIGSKTISVTPDWHCYHDHNYGRFNWGDDVGWTWFVASLKNSKGIKTTYVFHRSNNKAFTEVGVPFLFIYENNQLKKIFLGDSVDLKWDWSASPHMPPVLPGAMASLFSDRNILMPQRISIKAADDKDYMYLEMIVQNAAEMILPDYRIKQYTFLKEMTGYANSISLLNGKKTTLKDGFFYAEYVH
jgi:hypothetical protein